MPIITEVDLKRITCCCSVLICVMSGCNRETSSIMHPSEEDILFHQDRLVSALQIDRTSISFEPADVASITGVYRNTFMGLEGENIWLHGNGRFRHKKWMSVGVDDVLTGTWCVTNKAIILIPTSVTGCKRSDVNKTPYMYIWMKNETIQWYGVDYPEAAAGLFRGPWLVPVYNDNESQRKSFWDRLDDDDDPTGNAMEFIYSVLHRGHKE